MFDRVVEIIKEAGDLFKEGYEKNLKIQNKGIKDLLTEYDLKIEKFLIKNLGEISQNIIAEETLYNENLEDTFIIDPIDGTTNYAHHIPYCSISLAYYRNNRPLFSIVYNPTLEELFFAIKGEGAYLNNEKISVSNIEDFQRSLIGTGFPYSSAENENDLNFVVTKLKKILPRCQDIRRLGSASLDLCYVASGKLEGFYEINLKPWDVAGGMLIVSEAGGIVTNCYGESYNLFEDACIVATNGKIHEKIVEILQR